MDQEVFFLMKKFLIALAVYLVYFLLVHRMSKTVKIGEDIKDILQFGGFIVFMLTWPKVASLKRNLKQIKVNVA